MSSSTLIEMAASLDDTLRAQGDLTALAHKIADHNGHRDWQQIRNDIAEALYIQSRTSHGTLGIDACGVWDAPWGESIAWWHTNAYTRWMMLDDCDPDQLRDLGLDEDARELEAGTNS